ncbi:MAG: methyltransferase domain-containing protein [Coriobacteriia bacterium]|nr:methyltransferase domain-containing protein [Coriobacteriia bacterium]
MGHFKFDISKLEKLNDPGRFETLPPEVFWEALGKPDDAREIVEIGAGTGLFAAQFVSFAPDAIVHAVDTEKAMIEWMKENRPEVERGRLVPTESEETHVPLPDELADVVFMINLHHELAEPASTYAEAFRLLKPGGRVLVVDWAPFETPKGPPLTVRVTAEDLAAHVEGAGFAGTVIHGDLPWHSMVTGTKPAARGQLAIPVDERATMQALDLLAAARKAFVAARDRIPFTVLERGTAEYVAAAFLWRATSSVEAVEHLVEKGHPAEGLIILRSLVEDVCSLSYILSEPDRLAGVWCDFETERIAKYYDDLAIAMPTEEVKTAAREALRSMGQKPRANRANWWSGMSPHAMARRAESVYPGTLRFYLLLYAALCDIAHFNAPALGMYVPLVDDFKTPGTHGHDVLMTVQTTLAVLSEIALRIDDFLQLGLDVQIRPLAENASVLAALAARGMSDSIANELLNWVREQDEG